MAHWLLFLPHILKWNFSLSCASPITGSSHQPFLGPRQFGHHSTFHSLILPPLQAEHHQSVLPHSALCPLQVPYFNIFYDLVLILFLLISSPLVSFLSVFQALPPSPIGGRRKQEDVEGSGFSFARSRLTPTPRGERTETIVSVGA